MFGYLRSTTRSLANAQADCALPTAIGSLPPSANLEAAKAGASGSNSYHLHCILWLKVIALLVTLSGVDMATCRAQNLVPNPSFEDFTDCPDYWAAVGNVVSWSSCGYSPDYFNACRDSADVGVPFNVAGYQYAAEGNGYCGLVTFDSTSATTREIICAELDQPLIAGQVAYASMKVSPGGFGSALIGSTPGFTCKGVGLRFSLGAFIWPQAYPNDAVIFLDDILLDTAGWTLIAGSFVPDSNYTHVLIGNFFNDSLSSPERLDPSGDILGYVFVDQVCVSHQAGVCYEGSAVPEQGKDDFRVYPNPFGDELVLGYSGALGNLVHIEIVDLSGRSCFHRTITGEPGRIQLDVSHLANGCYLLHMATRNNRFTSSPLLKVSP